MKKILLLFLIASGISTGIAAQTNKIETTGYVGIGTTSPTNLLDVRGGNIYTNGSVFVDGGDVVIKRTTTPFGYVVRPNVVGYKKLQFAVEGGGPLENFTAYADNSYFTGNVGIGIPAPSYKLQVLGRISVIQSGEARYHLFNGGGTAEWIMGQKSISHHNFTISKSVAGTETDMFSITPSGNIGIGTIAPSAPLSVSTSAQEIAQFKATGTNNVWASVSNNTGQLNLGIGSANPHPYMWSSTDKLFIGSDGANPTIFVKGMAGGNVGIGTTSVNDVNYKLFVATGIRTRKVRVDQDTWSDYVFDKDYRLPSLEEVEQYIQKHKHLPDVPSALDVEKDGLDLGDNQAVLLKKIEEITLYLIQKDKEVGLLNKKTTMQEQLIKELQTRLTIIEKTKTD